MVSLLGSVLCALALTACGDPARRALGGPCTDDSACESGLCSYGACLDPAADEDQDGLTNATEAALGANPFNPDTDYDGVPDGDEIGGGGLDHGAPDTDGDGHADILESRVADADEDCLPDELDPDTTAASDLAAVVPLRCEAHGVCGAHPDAVRIRCDAHGAVTCIYDAVPGWQAFESDCDGLDNDCDGRTDEAHPDLDGDQLADCVDGDRDGDDAPDGVGGTDNCPNIANADQEDADSDGAGDACDAPPAPVLTGFDPSSPGHLASIDLRGTTEPHATVSAFAGDSDVLLGQATAGGSGLFRVPVTVGTGTTTFTLQATNRAGLTSPRVVAALTYDLDLQVPEPPVLASAAFIQTSGGGTQLRFFLRGAVEPGGTVSLYAKSDCGGDPIDAVPGTLTEAGAWFLDALLPAANQVVYANTTDRAGNVSPCAALVQLEGDIVLATVSGGVPQGGTAIQIHDAFGKPKALLTSDEGGHVTAHIRAGDGATAAFPQDAKLVNWRWVSVLGLVPGGSARLGLSEGGSKLAATPNTSVQFHWPTAPAGSAYYCMHLRCGPQCVPVSADTKSGATFEVSPNCLSDGLTEPGGLASVPTFVTVEDVEGRPTRFATANIDLPGGLGSQVMVEIPAWRTDWIPGELDVHSEEGGGSFQARLSLVVDGVQYPMNQDAAAVDGFVVAGGTYPIKRLFPAMFGASFSWQIVASHVAVGNGIGIRGARGRTPSIPYTGQFDFDADLLPRVFQSEVQWTDVRPTIPLSLTWAAEPALADLADLMTVNIDANSIQATGASTSVQWTIFARATAQQTLAIPMFQGTFPGAVIYNAGSGISVSGPTFFDAAAVAGFEGFLQCGGDLACLSGAQGLIRWSSCCESVK